MSDSDRTRWDERYAAGEYAGRTHPTALLAHWLPHIRRGRALDIACGAGRNALFLASEQFQVDGVDISAVALSRAAADAERHKLDINFINLDFDTSPLPDGPYRLIVVSRFLDHRLIPQMLDRLTPGGWVIYEQHLRTEDDDVGGPRNARFRLREQELLHLFSSLTVQFYYEGRVDDPGGQTMALAQLVGRLHG